MKKSSRLIVVLVAAASTFGSLYAFVGTDHWNRYHYDHHGYYDHGCKDMNEDNSEE